MRKKSPIVTFVLIICVMRGLQANSKTLLRRGNCLNHLRDERPAGHHQIVLWREDFVLIICVMRGLQANDVLGIVKCIVLIICVMRGLQAMRI